MCRVQTIVKAYGIMYLILTSIQDEKSKDMNLKDHDMKSIKWSLSMAYVVDEIIHEGHC